MYLLRELVGEPYFGDEDLNRVFAGKRISDFPEFLSYADEFSVEGSFSRYEFVLLNTESSDPNVMIEGDGHMVIGADGDLIVGAACSIYER